MWFEVLPPAAIMVVALALPYYAGYGIHSLVLGNPYRRATDTWYQRWLYKRDRELTDNPYIVQGLDSVPDED